MKRSLIILFCCLTACTPSPKVIWKFATGAPIYGSPSVWHDSLIVGSNDHFLYALGLQTGLLQWKRNMGERVLSKPLIEGNRIYVGTGSGNFMALDPSNGQILWTYKTGATIQYDACSDEEGAFVGSWDSHFYKIKKGNGQKLWDFRAGYWLTGHCATYKNLVFTSSWDNFYYGLDRSTGKLVWKTNAGNFNYGGAELAGDRVYFTTHYDLFVLDAMTGKILFRRKTGYLKDTAVGGNYLYTFDAGLNKRTLSGEVVARYPIEGTSETRPVLWKDQVIVTYDNHLLGVSTDMKLRWKWKGGETFWSPGVVHDNYFFAGNRDSNVYAFRLPD